MQKAKRILITLAFAILILLLNNTNKSMAGYQYLNNLEFNVQINKDGSINVEEIWDIEIEETNTLFKTFETDSTKYTGIENVKVTEITNGTKEFIQIDELMYHVTKDCYYGMKNDDGEFEIAWGVGLDNSEDTRKYKISYTVKDAIAKYTDYAELYWQFVGEDFEIDAKKIKGTILLPEKVSNKDEIKVWGHTENLNGEIYVTDLDKIEFEVNKFNYGTYVEVRSLFPTEMITTSGRIKNKIILDEVIEEETKWANEANRRRELTKKVTTIISIVYLSICGIVGIVFLVKAKKDFKQAKEMVKLKPTIDLQYFREMPRKNATPAQAVYVMKKSTAILEYSDIGKIFAATLLNLNLKKYIDFEVQNNGKKKEDITIKILKRNLESLPRSEKEIFNYVIGAAKSDNIITVKELEKYMKKSTQANVKRLESIKDGTEDGIKDELETEGIFNKKEAKEYNKYYNNLIAGIAAIVSIIIFFGIFLATIVQPKVAIIGVIIVAISGIIKIITGIKLNNRRNPYTEKGLNENKMWKGLKKYMEEFSMLDKREIPEIALWEEFLVYATAFGIADKVLKQLKIIYPNLEEMADINTYSYMNLMIHTDFASSFSNAISSSMTSAYSSVYSSGSGGGGGFSGGGGGGRRPEVAVEVDKMKSRKKEVILIGILIIIQTIIFIIAGVNKSYIHMDEAYSLGLASYDKTEIQNNEDFYNNWHNKQYYEDYLAVEDDEVGQYSQVYENQKNDVHPPLYYLILRFAMGFSKNHFSVWPGIIINIIIFAFITIFMYLILQKTLDGKEKVKEKSIIVAFISSITMASLTNVIYIRMYALSALNILIITFLHMKLLDSEKINIKLLIIIGIAALIGSLTHYYYLFFLAMLYLLFAIKYIKEKRIKELIHYTLTMGIAGVASLVIFPYSIQHMFFGYRGQGVISKLTNIPEFAKSISLYIAKIAQFGFNMILPIILVGIIVIIIYKLTKKKKLFGEKNKYIKFIVFPTLFYFILVAIASPWVELRYIMPVCSVIFMLVIYCIYQLLDNILSEKHKNTVIILIFIIMLISPFIFKLEPEVAYSDKKEIVQKLGNELNVPTIYLFNSQNNRFLDDILLFSIINESYIAKDIECNEANIKQILQCKDISNGLVIFINEGQENDNLLEVIKNSTKLNNSTYLKRLNACDVYYLN